MLIETSSIGYNKLSIKKSKFHILNSLFNLKTKTWFKFSSFLSIWFYFSRFGSCFIIGYVDLVKFGFQKSNFSIGFKFLLIHRFIIGFG